jgi:hypothetical protein
MPGISSLRAYNTYYTVQSYVQQTSTNSEELQLSVCNIFLLQSNFLILRSYTQT